MNPNYKTEEAAAQATAGAAEELVQPPTAGQATAEYYGGTGSSTRPAWAAEAAMNPNYRREEAAAQATAGAAEELVRSPASGQASAEYYGGTGSSTHPAWAAEAAMNPDYKTEEAAAQATAGAAEELVQPPTAGQATADYYGGTGSSSSPAWAAEAAMNPNYKKEEAAAQATAAAAEELVPSPAGGQASAEYYGGTKSRTNPASAAEAAMNPDYKTEEAVTAGAAEELVQPPTAGQATAEYYGGTGSSTSPAWAAEAAMNPAYADRTPRAASSTSPPPSTPLHDATVEACRVALTSAAQAAKVYFANSSFEIAAGSQGTLREIAAIVKNCGDVVLEVGGHTDNTGAPDFNKTLSQLRAKVAVHFLIREGVDPAKLKAIGYGQQNPITTNDTAEGRSLNRRIEFLVTRR